MSRSLPIVIRGIALLEAAKGALALLVGIGLLSLGQRNLPVFAEQFVRLTHCDPASRYPRAFLAAVGSVSSADLWLLATVAFFYATIRLVEAYWLWSVRPWAEWFALGSTCFYLPVELYELTHHLTGLTVGVLVVNLAIAAYLANTLRQSAAGIHFLRSTNSTRARLPAAFPA